MTPLSAEEMLKGQVYIWHSDGVLNNPVVKVLKLIEQEAYERGKDVGLLDACEKAYERGYSKGIDEAIEIYRHSGTSEEVENRLRSLKSEGK